jgi:NADPH:quinone reductase-like Zn-dependent oxidoreductase
MVKNNSGIDDIKAIWRKIMKAIVYTQYGSPDVLHLQEVEKPVPGENEVLIQVVAASVNAADWHLLRAEPILARGYSGLLKPKYTILGSDVAGRVEVVGSNVTRFQPGDEVFGALFGSFGGFAEYVCAREDMLVLKPAEVSFEAAGAVPLAGCTALQALRDVGRVQAGQQVLIQGAGGGVGTFAVQIAKAFGAHVTAVCSTRNVEMVRSLGADLVIDYTQEDFTQNGQLYDLIFAANGYHPILEYRRALRPEGRCVMIGGTNAQMFQTMLLGPWVSMAGKKKMLTLTAKTNGKDLAVLKELLEDGKIAPVIDRRYPLSEVADAIRYLEEGHARGKVVIIV